MEHPAKGRLEDKEPADGAGERAQDGPVDAQQRRAGRPDEHGVADGEGNEQPREHAAGHGKGVRRETGA
ncbi:MAG: hypothetical protein JTJ29_11290 [Bifidobacterium sp.]|nr:hypothetical protein [Bifidobacterium sp.]